MLATLNAEQRAAYGGLPIVYASAWADWKPKQADGWKVDAVLNAQTTPFQVDSKDELQHLITSDHRFSSLRVLVPDTPASLTQQIEQFQTALRDKPDLIILEPIAPPAFAGLVTAAGKAGIPVVTFTGDVNSPYAINVNGNDYLNAAEVMSIVVRMIGGKGSLLYIHGVPGVGADSEAFAATQAVLKNCPKISLAGTVVGDFQPQVAKGAVLQFVATHPQALGAVMQAGGMAEGAIQAFETSGRKVPPVADAGANAGSLSYWLDHRSTYDTAGFLNGGVNYGQAIADVTLRVLLGQEPKVDEIAPPVPLVTDANLQAVATAHAAITDATAVSEAYSTFLPDAYLNEFFNKGTTPTP